MHKISHGISFEISSGEAKFWATFRTFILTPIFSFEIVQHRKWFESGDNSQSCSLISQVRVVLRGTVVGDLSHRI